MFFAKYTKHSFLNIYRTSLLRKIKMVGYRNMFYAIGIVFSVIVAHTQTVAEPNPIEGIRTDQKANLSALGLKIGQSCLKSNSPFLAYGRVQNASRKKLKKVEVVLIANGALVGRQKLDFDSFETKELRFEWSAAPDPRTLLLTMIVDPEFSIIDRDRADNIVELPVFIEMEKPEAVASIDALDILSINAQPVAIQLRLRNPGADRMRIPVSIKFGDRTIYHNLTKFVEPGSDIEIRVPWPAGKPFEQPIKASTQPCLEAPGRILLPNSTATLQVSGSIKGVRGYYRVAPDVNLDVTVPGGIAAFVQPSGPVGEWQSIGPTLIDDGLGAVGRLGSVAIDPSNPEIIYVAARAAGVWKTTDGGANWAVVADALPTLRIEDVDLSPVDSSTVFVTTKNNGIYRSDDSGATWFAVTMTDLDATGSDGHGLFIHPTDPNQMFLTSRGGLRYSNNGGTDWTIVFPILGSERISAFAFDTDTLSRAWMSVNGTAVGRSGIYVAPLTGTAPMNWRRLNGCPGARLPQVSEDVSIKLAFSKGRLFASHKEPDSWALYRTTNVSCQTGGVAEQSWELAWNPQHSLGGVPVHRWLWSAIYVDPINPKFVYAAGTDLWHSSDFGDTFKRAKQPHVDHHGFAFHPNNPEIIFTGSDGGLYRSNGRGKDGTWSFIGEGLRITEFYTIADSAKQPNVVYGGTQDNGASVYDGNDTTWHYLVGGDSEGVEIDDHDSNIFFELGQEMRQLKKSAKGSNSTRSDFSNISEDLPEGCPVSAEFGPHPNHFMVHPRDSEILLATCNGLWKGLPWKQDFAPQAGRLTRLAIDPQSDTYFAGSTQGAIFAGIGGLSFQQVYKHPEIRQLVDLERDIFQSDVMYAAFTGNNLGRVMRLTRDNSGSAELTGTDLSQGLPAGGINSLAVDLLLDDTIYVATRRSGVFKGQSNDNWATWTWTPYVNGMHSATNVMELQVHPTTGVLRAATFGRGAYEVQTDTPLGTVLAAKGRLTFLRVHDVGTGFGPPFDFLDAEAIVRLDSDAKKVFGLQLRGGPNEAVNSRMLDLLRNAFRQNTPVRIEYERIGPRSGRIIRVTRI